MDVKNQGTFLIFLPFESVKDENKLLKAAHSYLQIKSSLCGCRALGLINKFVTGPLWRLLESGIHILEFLIRVNTIKRCLQNQKDVFDLSVDAKEFMSGYFLKMLKFLKMFIICLFYHSNILPLDESTNV